MALGPAAGAALKRPARSPAAAGRVGSVVVVVAAPLPTPDAQSFETEFAGEDGAAIDGADAGTVASTDSSTDSSTVAGTVAGTDAGSGEAT